jgi:hypothetical protein
MKIITAVILAFLAIPFGFVALLFFFGGDMCGNYVHSTMISPDKRHKAVVFQRDCGATTGFTTQISILEKDDSLANSSGNIFIIDGHPNSAAPEIFWVTNDEIFIDRAIDGTEYKAKSSLGLIDPVAIRYGSGVVNKAKQ